MEKLKLVNEKGETILMTQSEYLELAKQKGWDTKIPQLEGGTCDCDVFGGDGVDFNFFLDISGTLCLKDNVLLEADMFAHDGIILGDHADTYDLFSDGGDVVLGNNADTCELTGKNVICGDCLYANNFNISATDGVVILGKDYDVDYGKVFSTEDILCDDEPTP